MSPIAKTVSLCLVFITIVVGMFVYTTVQVPQLSEDEMRSKGVFILPKPRDIAAFELSDQFGAGFDNARLKGKWTFIFFGFTHCPDICPTSMAVLGQVDRGLQGSKDAESFQGILVSVDPERDTPEVLAPYVKAFSPRFLGVTGTREDIFQLANQVNVAFAKVPAEGGYTMDHTGNIVIINPMGHYHGFAKLPHDAETIRLTYQSLAARF